MIHNTTSRSEKQKNISRRRNNSNSCCSSSVSSIGNVFTIMMLATVMSLSSSSTTTKNIRCAYAYTYVWSSPSIMTKTTTSRTRLRHSSSSLYSSPSSASTVQHHHHHRHDHHHSREEKQSIIDRNSKLQLAPMMDYTDRHFRYLVRLVSRRTLLWTEMIAANTLAYEKRQQITNLHEQQQLHQNNDKDGNAVDHYSDEYLRRYLGQAGRRPISERSTPATATTTTTTEGLTMAEEGPCVLQLGGSSPDLLAEAAETVIDMTNRGWCDYTSLNLNVGCPSPKVAGKGCFGAALMDDPVLVKDLCRALHDGSNGRLPVSVKCRIGTDTYMNGFSKDAYACIDPDEEYKRLCHFIETIASDGIVKDFTVHARIAVLQKSFSPADNRKVPPLKYDLVRRLVRDYPELKFTLNGGIDTITQAQHQFEQSPELLGVMTGRAWAADPWSFAMADHLLYDDEPIPQRTRWDILNDYARYADEEERHNDPVKIRRFIIKAITTLFTGEPNAKRYRIALDEIAGIPKKLHSQGQSLGGQPPISELILNAATTYLSEDVLHRTPQESFERKLHQESEDRSGLVGAGAGSTSGKGRSAAISEWQSERLSGDTGAEAMG